MAIFVAMQVAAQLFFKWGSGGEGRWLKGFIGGNLFGFSSIWLLMQVYKQVNINLAMGICIGGSFLLSQLVLAIVFKSVLSPV